jgi:excisionase family DNA binding protein
MKEILTLPEACELLRISRRTMFRLLASGEVPGVKLGGSWRFSRDLLLRIIEDGGALTFDGKRIT